MKSLIPKIGLEIHLELQTKTKLFCFCKNDPENIEPNKNICPICTGQPGVLPVLNKQAVIYAYSLAHALKMKINEKSFFARKHYFYPDLPKNYQISQYEIPLAIDGEFLIIRDKLQKKVRIKRLHLEEDTASNIHINADSADFTQTRQTNIQNADKYIGDNQRIENPRKSALDPLKPSGYSLVDFNRSGIPLIEIVTEPDLNSEDEVEAFAEDFILLIRYLKISSASAEKGQIRFEANISLAEDNKLGTKVEIKNIAKVQSLKEAVAIEIERQKKLLEKGEKIIQETRGYDEIKKITFSQRTKEEAHDYRYFIEPDLPPLFIDEEIKKETIFIETPWEKRIRFKEEYKIDFKTIDILVRNQVLANFFEETFSELYKLTSLFEETKKLIINFLINDILGLIQKYKIEFNQNLIHPHEFAHLLFNFYQNKISSKIVKEALEKTIKGEAKIEDIIKEKEKISSIEILSNFIEEVIKENQKIVEDYLNGNTKSFEFLMGQVMKKTKGRADPKLTREILLDYLKNNNKT
jgi:aspartyl-tRNA(Asn)/glutamyl-tRNA(Gln) amidotransferase subunit B